MDVWCHFVAVSASEYRSWVAAQGRQQCRSSVNATLLSAIFISSKPMAAVNSNNSKCAVYYFCCSNSIFHQKCFQTIMVISRCDYEANDEVLRRAMLQPLPDTVRVRRLNVTHKLRLPLCKCHEVMTSEALAKHEFVGKVRLNRKVFSQDLKTVRNSFQELRVSDSGMVWYSRV